MCEAIYDEMCRLEGRSNLSAKDVAWIWRSDANSVSSIIARKLTVNFVIETLLFKRQLHYDDTTIARTKTDIMFLLASGEDFQADNFSDCCNGWRQYESKGLDAHDHQDNNKPVNFLAILKFDYFYANRGTFYGTSRYRQITRDMIECQCSKNRYVPGEYFICLFCFEPNLLKTNALGWNYIQENKINTLDVIQSILNKYSKFQSAYSNWILSTAISQLEELACRLIEIDGPSLLVQFTRLNNNFYFPSSSEQLDQKSTFSASEISSSCKIQHAMNIYKNNLVPKIDTSILLPIVLTEMITDFLTCI